MLLLQEFNLEIRDKKGADNIVADHLHCIKGKIDPVPIRDDFPDEQLLLIAHGQPWFADICNFLVTSTFSPGASKFKAMQGITYGMTPIYGDVVMTACILNSKIGSVLIFSILHLEVATMNPPRRPKKYLNVDSIGQLFFETHTNLSRSASNVKKPEWP
ncbi:hypothetical protein CR513_01975, partial [Mucuna pruriens]